MAAVRRLRASGAGQLDAYFNAAPELLGAIVDVLDVGTAFPRLSGIVQKMLPEGAWAKPGLRLSCACTAEQPYHPLEMAAPPPGGGAWRWT
jgi:hypothetical protein